MLEERKALPGSAVTKMINNELLTSALNSLVSKVTIMHEQLNLAINI